VRIEVSTLRPGVSFTKPVYIEDDNLLVPAGIAVRKRDIQHLTSWGIYTVETDGEMVLPRLDRSVLDNPGDANLGDANNGAAQNAAARENEPYRRIVQSLEAVYAKLAAKTLPQSQEISGIAAALRRAMEEGKSRFAALAAETAALAAETAAQSAAGKNAETGRAVFMAVLAVRMGAVLRLSASDLEGLVNAALLHGTGSPLPAPVLLGGTYGENEQAPLKAHFALPLKIAREYNWPLAGRILSQHHEWEDGRGWPGKAAGGTIENGAKILAAAEAYTALPGGASGPAAGQDALNRLVREMGRRYAPPVIKALARALAVYPAGSFVALNDNAVAVVMETAPAAPLRPKIRIVIDGAGRKSALGTVIDLAQNKNLHIVRAVDAPVG
jgi:HD-GYP domain-containing protein (c-di-GMP phosphodiesterase class II)